MRVGVGGWGKRKKVRDEAYGGEVCGGEARRGDVLRMMIAIV